MPTPSQLNPKHCEEFVKTLHTTPYASIDPSLTKLPTPFVVCIIGGHGAAGDGLARAYAKAGASGILLASRNRTKLEATAHQARNISLPPPKVVTATCDITSAASVQALVHTTMSEFGRLDVLIVNAGYSEPMIRDVVQESPIDFKSAFDVHVLGTFHAAHYFLPLLLSTRSLFASFISISSMGAPTVTGIVSHAHYCVSKAAQMRLMEVIREQYGAYGIFCVSVHPGGLVGEMAMMYSSSEVFSCMPFPPIADYSHAQTLLI